jgi:hypothetical protein
VRCRKWAEMVHRPIDEAVLDAIRRSNATGLPYGDEAWTKRLAKRLDLDLTLDHPPSRPAPQSKRRLIKIVLTGSVENPSIHKNHCVVGEDKQAKIAALAVVRTPVDGQKGSELFN